MVQNKGFILKKLPHGWPVAGEDLVVEDRPFDLDSATPPPKGILIKNYYFSFDPYQRGRMRDPSIKSYTAAYPVGQPITNRGISKVVKSDNPKFKPGDVIVSSDVTPMEEYSQMGEAFVENARLLDNPYHLDPKVYLGALGMPGLTAYSSFYEIGQPKKGETIFISAASGAVGQIVGQLAKHEGLKVIGSVGDDKKLDFIINELGFDSGFNYKKEKPGEALARLAPDGLDIYYENVGGEQLEAAINALNQFGRIGGFIYPILLGLLTRLQLRVAWFLNTTPNLKTSTRFVTSCRSSPSDSRCVGSLLVMQTWGGSTFRSSTRMLPSG
jgi:NADPH-dependent curcumin reductase CurA